MRTNITIPLPPDPITDTERKLHFTGLEINPNLEMVLKTMVVYYADNDTPMLSWIEANEDLSIGQKRLQVQKFTPQHRTAETSGTFVDVTGEPVQLDEENNPPEGSMPELEFWQNITLDVFFQGQPLPDAIVGFLKQVRFADLFYAAIANSMQSMSNRLRV